MRRPKEEASYCLPVTYLHADHLGSTVLTTEASGSQRYDAYGNTRSGSVPTEWQYTGQEQDGTGLVYMHARYYDPVTGIFISPDTIIADSNNLFDYNRYMYARGNPLKFTDPSGHCTESIGDEDFECFQAAYQVYQNWPHLVLDELYTMTLRDLLDMDATLWEESHGMVEVQSIGKNVVAYLIGAALPGRGAESAGVTGSVGWYADGSGSFDVIRADANGNIGLFAWTGRAGFNNGLSGDVGVAFSSFPNAESIDVFAGTSVNTGASVDVGASIGVEWNRVPPSLGSEGLNGYTVSVGLGLPAGTLPVPLVEVGWNAGYSTTPKYSFNVYSQLGVRPLR